MSDSDNDYDDTDMLVKDEDDRMADPSGASEGADNSGEVKKKYDPKDPLRPRRKKARRACFACQRAHLTCGKPLPLPFAVLISRESGWWESFVSSAIRSLGHHHS